MKGDSPPCTQNNLFSTRADKLKKSNISVQYLQTLRDPNFFKHSS